MRLVIRRGSSLINDLKFDHGPIYIGRHRKSQVFLPDRGVSRQHAVIVINKRGEWAVQNLRSENNTMLNGHPIATHQLHEGDVISIADFTLETHFSLDNNGKQRAHIDLGDTIFAPTTVQMSSIFSKQRRTPMHLDAKRGIDFYHICNALCKIEDSTVLLTKLIPLLHKQFNSYHVWAGLRDTTSGALTCHGGSNRGGAAVSLEQIFGKHMVSQALKRGDYILMPDVQESVGESPLSSATLKYLKSAMACPITTPEGIYGVIYIDNGSDHSAYGPKDLDYLLMVTSFIAGLVEHI